jgi:hypothetical protein
MTYEIRPQPGATIPPQLSTEIQQLAERASIEIELEGDENALRLAVKGTPTESKYLARCLLRAGYDLAI